MPSFTIIRLTLKIKKVNLNYFNYLLHYYKNMDIKQAFKKYKIEFIFAGVVILILLTASKSFSGKNDYEIKGAVNPTPQASVTPSPTPENKGPLSPITGESCENAGRRSVAVMLAIDRETRPLSGLSEADMVFEMPVITNGATRLMAVFGCNIPQEIGSIRSSRHDYIDLALWVDAIYAHWGGSHFALDRLKMGVIDDLDALANYNNAFYRKNSIPAPHNGFTSGERLLKSSEKLGYRLENKFSGFLHEENQKPAVNPSFEGQNSGKLIIGYPGDLRVEYKYDAAENSYLRWRGGIKEVDKNNGSQVSARNIAVMYARSRQIEGDYNDVDLDGQGRAEFYFNGEKIDGNWKKDGKKFVFTNDSGEEIKFTPGNMWVEIIQTDQKAEWKE